MTDRYKGLVVSLEKDYRDDDSDNIINAIRMIRGVLNVEPLMLNSDDHINRSRIRLELTNKIWEVLKNE